MYLSACHHDDHHGILCHDARACPKNNLAAQTPLLKLLLYVSLFSSFLLYAVN